MGMDCEKKVEEIIDAYEGSSDSLISILQDIQAEYRYLPEEAMRLVAEKMTLPLIQIYGVATFFRAFSLEPQGRHVLSVCTGTACHVRGAAAVLDEVQREIGIGPGSTTDDMQFSLETVNCLGACALGPILVVDGKYHGQMVAGKISKVLEKIQ